MMMEAGRALRALPSYPLFIFVSWHHRHCVWRAGSPVYHTYGSHAWVWMVQHQYHSPIKIQLTSLFCSLHHIWFVSLSHNLLLILCLIPHYHFCQWTCTVSTIFLYFSAILLRIYSVKYRFHLTDVHYNIIENDRKALIIEKRPSFCRVE
jgi:hypothetical protein